MNPSEVALTLEQAKRLAELDPKHFVWDSASDRHSLLLDVDGNADLNRGYLVVEFLEDETPVPMWHPLRRSLLLWMLSELATVWDEFTTVFVNGGTPIPGVREQYEAIKPAMKAEGYELGAESGSKIILSSYIAYLEARSAGGSKT